ncbi:MAG: hypothetical protein CVV56_03830 [Tenericutes bacterium HGW-Tenericutes-1]|jgi:putative MATE family efflux protein|nr:MAG: hypothetical protein CVV56_03830 [Tenericutes bacterium HGW-Tenericutes-1]
MAKMYDMTKGSIFKNLLVVALPVLLTSISQMAYNLTDMFWIGRVDAIGLNESDAISGIGTAGYITWFAFGLILIAKIGTSVKVSHAAGAKQHDMIEKYATNGLSLSIILGLIFSITVFFFKEDIVNIFNIGKPEVVIAAIDYLSIVGTFFFVQFFTSGFSAINEGLGKTALNFSILVIGLSMNMILDPIFILDLKMGVSGAALATVISQVTTLSVFIIIYFVNRKTAWRYQMKHLEPKMMGDIFKIGIFAGLQSMFFTSISIIIARMIFFYGEQVMAAQRLGSQIEQLTWMIAGGFQTALTVFVGQNFGAKHSDRIKKGTIMLSKILIPYSLLIGAMLFFLAEPLMRIFVDTEETIAFGKQYLQIISVAQVFMMLEGIGTGLFNGVGKSIVPSIVGIAGNTLRIPFAYLLSGIFGYVGIWWTLNLSDIVKGFVMLVASIVILLNVDKMMYSRKVRKKQTINAQ